MTLKETKELIEETIDPMAAAVIAFSAIKDFSDLEMGDGDAARGVAEAWLLKFVPGAPE